MPRYDPRVYARIFSHRRVPGGTPRTLRFVIEYSFLSDPARSGKVEVNSDVIENGPQLTDDLTDALAKELALRYPGDAPFTTRDVVGLGV